MRKRETIAAMAAEKIIEKLSGRKGFDSWWDDIDEDIQSEILEEMEATIRFQIAKALGVEE